MSTTANDRGFLNAIIEEPDEDIHRFAYADWFMERGDPRGEFVMLQCELARMPEDDPRRAALAEKEEALATEYRKAWRAELPAPAGVKWAGDFSRGFPQAIRFSNGTAFLRHAATVFDAAPIRAAEIYGLTPRTAAGVARSRCLARLHVLYLGGRIGDAGAAALAHSPHLTRLSALGASMCSIGPAGIAELASSPSLSGLTDLLLDYNLFGPQGAAALAGSRSLGRLTWLGLAGNSLRDEGAVLLAGSSHLRRLARIDLSFNFIGAAGTLALVTSPILERVTELDLSQNRLGNAQLRALASSPKLRSLVCLDLDENPFGPKGIRALAASHSLPRLRRLRLLVDDAAEAAEVANLLRSRPRLTVVVSEYGFEESVRADLLRAFPGRVEFEAKSAW